MDFKKETDNLLKDLKARGFTQVKIAGFLGYSEKSISQIQNKGGTESLFKSIFLFRDWVRLKNSNNENIEGVEKDIVESDVNLSQPDQSQSPALQRLLAVQEELRKAIEELKGGSLPPASGRAGKGKISRVRSKLKDTGNKKGTVEPG